MNDYFNYCPRRSTNEVLLFSAECPCLKRLLFFLSRVSTLRRDIDIAILYVRLSVCLSVRLSFTFQYSIETASDIVIVFHQTVAKSF